MKGNLRISSSLAQMIVDAAKEVIGKDINFIQLDGKVIASTNPDRIGSYHAAAHLVKETKDVVEVTEEHVFKGAKKGINYPVMIETELLGVIGISGDPKECKSLGFLLTKITEVLIKEQRIKSANDSLDDLRSSIVRMLIFEDQKEDIFIKDQLQQLQYELEERAFVSVVQFHGLEYSTSHPVKLNEKLVGEGVKLFTYLFPNQYILIANQSQYHMILQTFTMYLSSMNMNYSVGVGSIGNIDELSQSYKHAKLALKYALSKKAKMFEYVNLDIEVLMENIDISIRNDYITKMTGKLSNEEIKVLQTYYNNNLSLKETAEELFIHKNTLQYRLEKVSQKTGVNPRNYHDSVKLYVALLLQTL